MKRFAIIAVDIGGTYIRANVIDSLKSLPDSPGLIFPTNQKDGALGVLSQIRRCIRTLLEDLVSIPFIGISITSPGLVMASEGRVRIALNLPEWSNVELAKSIREEFSLPVLIENDANAGALAEWYYTFDRRIASLIFVTVSTGIGAGIIESGRLLSGATEAAGELGHMSVDMDGPPCHECGKSKGCLTAIASGTSIVNHVKSNCANKPDSPAWALCGGRIEQIDSELVEKAARQGDEIALEAYRRAGRALGQGIVNVIHLLDPAVITLGGGVLSADDLILGPLFSIVAERLIDGERSVIIHKAGLGSIQCTAGAAVNGFIRWHLVN